MTEQDRQSTFALDVDTASYSQARNTIMNEGRLPPIASIRMEEFVNAFDYNYPGCSDRVFTVHAAAAPSPFGDAGKGLALVKVGVRGMVKGRDGRKPAHLVLVVDASGSMARPDRLPLVKHAMRLLVQQLSAADAVSLVTYGTRAQLALEAAPASNKQAILEAIDAIQADGSTNMLEGLALGYQMARRAFEPGAINRVILCSDGVANVGQTQAQTILDNVKAYRDHGITFTSVGFGRGTYNDELLEALANKGDGNYVYVDSRDEAKRVFVDGLVGWMQTIAKDAKIQVEFDAARVRRYRLVGYENRDIADKDFRNDAIDAGEVGSGQASTALYEVELLPRPRLAGRAPDLGTVYVRYRNAETGAVEEMAHRLSGDIVQDRAPSGDPRFYLAACAAEFAELLRQSEHAKGGNFAAVRSVLEEVTAALPLDTAAQELLSLVRRAEGLPRATE